MLHGTFHPIHDGGGDIEAQVLIGPVSLLGLNHVIHQGIQLGLVAMNGHSRLLQGHQHALLVLIGECRIQEHHLGGVAN